MEKITKKLGDDFRELRLIYSPETTYDTFIYSLGEATPELVFTKEDM